MRQWSRARRFRTRTVFSPEVPERCLFLAKSFFLSSVEWCGNRGDTVREQRSAPLRDSRQLYYMHFRFSHHRQGLTCGTRGECIYGSCAGFHAPLLKNQYSRGLTSPPPPSIFELVRYMDTFFLDLPKKADNFKWHRK